MKNVQVIDGGLNTTYSIYQFTDEQFSMVFPEPGQDIEFIEDVIERLGTKEANKIFEGVWDRLIKKTEVHGIHGTLFYELTYKKNSTQLKKNTK